MMRETAEIDSILMELNHSIDAHYKWLVKMFHCVVLSDVTQADISGKNSHCACQFGQWLTPRLVKDDADYSYLSKINAAHEKCIY